MSNPRCEHGARWGQCAACTAAEQAAVERAAERLDTVQNMSAQERAALKAQIDATRLPLTEAEYQAALNEINRSY